MDTRFIDRKIFADLSKHGWKGIDTVAISIEIDRRVVIGLRCLGTLAVALLLMVSPAASEGAQRIALCTGSFLPNEPQHCTLEETKLTDGTSLLTFRVGQQRLRIQGRSRQGWWSGTWDGLPAMGVELNRKHLAISSMDLKHTFEFWLPGYMEGAY